MKNTIPLFGLLFLLGSPALSNTATETVSLENQGPVELSAGNVSIRFRLLDSESKQYLSDSDLAVSHEKKLHFFFFDSALKEFRHEHPVFANGVWTVSTSLTVDGNYRIWAQGQTNGGVDFASSSVIKVLGGAPPNSTPAHLEEMRSGTSGNSVVTIGPGTIRAGQMVMLDVMFSHSDETTPTLSPYLGAFAHVVAVPLDGSILAHVHPMENGPNQLMLHTTFPVPGDYRLWIQFIDGDVLKTIPLALHAAEGN